MSLGCSPRSAGSIRGLCTFRGIWGHGERTLLQAYRCCCRGGVLYPGMAVIDPVGGFKRAGSIGSRRIAVTVVDAETTKCGARGRT